MPWFNALDGHASGRFRLFQYLPFELQLMVFWEALSQLSRPRFVQLDVETIPVYSPTRTRHLTLGWQLKINNHTELRNENALEVARKLLQLCKSGYHVGCRFVKKYQVWDPPRHSQEFLYHDLSLSSDIFWLPNDLYNLYWTIGFHRAGRDDHKDEERIAYLMVGMDALEEVVGWAMGRFDDQDLEDQANGYLSLDDLMSALYMILAQFPSCEEVIVMVSTPSGDRKHVSWSDLNYVPPEDEKMVSNFDLYAADQAEADRCQSLFQTYYAALRDDAPGLSFVFKKHRKPCIPRASVLQDPVVDGDASGKHTRDDDDAMPFEKQQQKVLDSSISNDPDPGEYSRDEDIDEHDAEVLSANKRQKAIHDSVSPNNASSKRSRDEDEFNDDHLPANKRQRIPKVPVSAGDSSGKRSRNDEDDQATVTPAAKRSKVLRDQPSTEAASGKRRRDDDDDDDILPAKKRQRF